MKNMLIGAAVAVAVMVMLAMTQDDGLAKQLQAIRTDLANIGLRVAKLEHAGGAMHSAASTGAAPAAAAETHQMVVGGIDSDAGVIDNQDEIDQLQGEADSLQDTVDYHQDLAAEAPAAVGSNTYYDHWAWHTNDRQAARVMVGQKSMANRYAAEHASKKYKIQQLENQQNLPRQIIHGHVGEVIITLHTKYDLSDKLMDISIGDVVTWTGRRISADEGSESWQIVTITKVEDGA